MAAESIRVIYAAIVANLAIAVTKFIAAGFTGSSAMLSEGIHSLVDTGNGGLMLLGVRRSGRPAALWNATADIARCKRVAAHARAMG